MIFSLSGLITFQRYWISNYLYAHKQEIELEIKRVLVRTSDRYLKDNIQKYNDLNWYSDTMSNFSNNHFNLFRNSSASSLDSIQEINFNNIESLGSDYIGQIENMINELLLNLNQPKVIDFDRLIDILDQELISSSIFNDYNVAVSNIESKVIYFKNPEKLQATIIDGFKNPIILSDISHPYFIHLLVHNQKKLVFEKTWIIFLCSLMLILIVLFCFAYSLYIIFNQKKISEIKNDFVNNMTHELKTPLSTISLALEALVNFDVRKDEDRNLKYLNISRKEVGRLNSMVEKVLNIAQYEKAGMDLNLESHSMNTLIENVVDSMTVQIQKKGGSLVFESTTDRDQLFVDVIHINNLFYNLIDNSNKYFQSIPEIHILSKCVDKKFFEVIISDNGIGISRGHLVRIFERFYRVPTGNIHNVKGYGLGLSYVKDIVEMHGGSISVESKISVGTKFIIQLPYDKKK